MERRREEPQQQNASSLSGARTRYVVIFRSRSDFYDQLIIVDRRQTDMRVLGERVKPSESRSEPEQSASQARFCVRELASSCSSWVSR